MNESSNVYRKIKNRIHKHNLNVENPQLILGKRQRSGKIIGGTYPIQSKPAARLRQVAASSVARMNRVEMSKYDGATVLDRETGVWVSSEQFRPDAPLIQFLSGLNARNSSLNAEQARSPGWSFYAIAFGTDENQVFFVRERAQHINAEAKIYLLVERAMKLVESPMLSLDTDIDFIIVDEGAAVFSAHAFEAYIQEPEDVERYVQDSVRQLTSTIKFGPNAAEALLDKGKSSLMARGRIRSVLGRPYLRTLTIKQVAEKIRAKNLNPADYIKGNALEFEPRHIMFVLKLLDQKVWLGDFDGTLYSTNAATPEQA